MKSDLSAMARSPAKFLIFSLKLTLLVVFKETSLTLANPSYSVETESLSSVSIASGPTNKFPWTVGVTKTPFPSLVGHWNIVFSNNLPWLLSKT